MDAHDWTFLGFAHDEPKPDWLLAICRQCGLVRGTSVHQQDEFSIDLSGDCATEENRTLVSEIVAPESEPDVWRDESDVFVPDAATDRS
jgi:hypothetical protein